MADESRLLHRCWFMRSIGFLRSPCRLTSCPVLAAHISPCQNPSVNNPLESPSLSQMWQGRCGKPACPCRSSQVITRIARPRREKKKPARDMQDNPISNALSPVRNAAYAVTLRKEIARLTQAGDFKAEARHSGPVPRSQILKRVALLHSQLRSRPHSCPFVSG